MTLTKQNIFLVTAAAKKDWEENRQGQKENEKTNRKEIGNAAKAKIDPKWRNPWLGTSPGSEKKRRIKKKQRST